MVSDIRSCPKCKNENIVSSKMGMWDSEDGKSYDPNLHTCAACFHKWQDADFLTAMGLTAEEQEAEKVSLDSAGMAQLIGSGMSMRDLGEYLQGIKQLQRAAKEKRGKQIRGILRARRRLIENRGSKASKAAKPSKPRA